MKTPITCNDETDFPEIWYSIARDDHFWFQWRSIVLAEQIRQLGIPTDEPLRVLDIGCGHGILCRQLEALTKWNIDGADLNKDALSLNCPKRGSAMYYDISDRRPELFNYYDCIFLFDVMEHIGDTNSFINSALYHLKPNGLLFVNVPAIGVLYSNYDRVAGHIRRYNKRMIYDQFMDRNAEVLDIRYWGLSLIPALLIRKILSSRKRSTESLMKDGFAPPSEQIHSLLKAVMRLECRMINNPIAGASVLAAIVKR